MMPYILLEWHSGYASSGGHVQVSLICMTQCTHLMKGSVVMRVGRKLLLMYFVWMPQT